MKWTLPFSRLLLGFLLAGLIDTVPVRAEPVTLGTLLEEMTDPERLTRLPEQPYRLLHASSYDRLALQPNTPAWFANADSCNYLRSETVNGRTEYVLLDADGPGVIVRFWTTAIWADNTLRIYLDNAATPQIEGTLTQIVGNNALAASPLSFLAPFKTGTIMTGHNLYLPIPFERHCKVTLSTPNNAYIYYNMDYRVYDSGAEVESFTMNALNVYHTEYVRALSALAEGHPVGMATSRCSRIEGRLTWGGDKRSITLSGPSAIRLVKLKLSAPDLAQALRSTHLEIDFDGEQGAVHCPIGDFFGTGGTVTPGSTWFAEVASNGVLQAFWTMPFHERATVRLVNHGQQSVDILQGEVWTGPYAWETNSMHFHAAWRDYPCEVTVGNKGKDVNYVTLQGRGRLVGDTLSIFNDASQPPHWCQNWWGEGDEKIFVDGEAFPSHFGTGSEDYYGYAWCSALTFNTPFIAQPLCSGNDKKGMTINTRLRLLDDIPYRTGLRFDMELLTWQPGSYRYAPTVYWYACPGGVCATPDPLANSVLPVPRTTSGAEAAPAVCPLGVRRDIESMTVLMNTGGAISCVTSNALGLNGESCVRWQNCGVGSRVEFGFPASFTGQCALAMRVLSGPSSGTLRLSINDGAATNTVALHAPLTAPSTIHLGTHLLRCGINTLTCEVTDTPAGTSQVEFAFDCLENKGPYYVSRVLPVLRERLEGEHLPVAVTCGEVTVDSNTGVSGRGPCAVWSEAQTGGVAAFKVVSEGSRQVPLTGVFLCATNGALCDISVNGQIACQALDLYRTEPVVTNVFLGLQVLLPGTNEIRVTVTGCAQGLDPSRLTVGLDCIDVGSLYALNMGKQTLMPLIGPCDDSDGDGLFNLAEYAFGGDSDHPDGFGLWPAPSVLRGDGLVFPVLSYRRRKPVSALPVLGTEGVNCQVDGVVYQVQQTPALGTETSWITTNMFGPTVMSIGDPDDDNGKTVRVRVRTVQPLSHGHSPSRFMRVGLREP